MQAWDYRKVYFIHFSLQKLLIISRQHVRVPLSRNTYVAYMTIPLYLSRKNGFWHKNCINHTKKHTIMSYLHDTKRYFICSILLMLLCCGTAFSQAIDFEKWQTRHIKESAIFGGKECTLYDLPRPWTTSNTHAIVLGMEKAVGSVYPIEHNHGKACLLKIEQKEFRVLDIPTYAIVTGSIYLGKTLEPVDIKGAANPMRVLNMNYAYTARPEALYFDYEAHIDQSNVISTANASTHIKTSTGKDGAEVILLLQHRWEDKDGHIHATRVATACMRIYNSTGAWVENFRLPLRYGDITQQNGYHKYEGLNTQGFMAQNSKGKMVKIEEEGFDANAQPTHIILKFSSGCQTPFSGHVGNWLKVDNVSLY